MLLGAALIGAVAGTASAANKAACTPGTGNCTSMSAGKCTGMSNTGAKAAKSSAAKTPAKATRNRR